MYMYMCVCITSEYDMYISLWYYVLEGCLINNFFRNPQARLKFCEFIRHNEADRTVLREPLVKNCDSIYKNSRNIIQFFSIKFSNSCTIFKDSGVRI